MSPKTKLAAWKWPSYEHDRLEINIDKNKMKCNLTSKGFLVICTIEIWNIWFVTKKEEKYIECINICVCVVKL
jgi:hypothetical protein